MGSYQQSNFISLHGKKKGREALVLIKHHAIHFYGGIKV
jgi:hypothetical protein